VAQEGQREPRCTSLLVCHAAHAHPGSSHALRGARSDGTIHNDPLAVFVLTGLFARRFWLGWGRTRHTAAVGKQALFMGETPRYTWTSGSTGTEISGRDLSGKRPLHRLIDFTAFELESYQKGCRKQQGWRPAKSRSFLQRFGRSEWISLLTSNKDNALYARALAKPDSDRHPSYRYKLSVCYCGSFAGDEPCHGEEICRAPARFYALQSVRN
jgi:hypothetical protein